MRTLLFLFGGLLLLAAFLLLGKLISANFANATRWATVAYIALWFIIAAANMWIGVANAETEGSGKLTKLRGQVLFFACQYQDRSPTTTPDGFAIQLVVKQALRR